MKKIFTRFFESLKQLGLYTVMIFSQIFRFLNSHVFGVLLLSLLAYFLWPRFFGVKPYTPTQMLCWFMEQEMETKTLFATSILTILGFLIAFQAGTASAKKQIQAQIRLDTASYIHSVYSDLLRQIIQMKIYAELNLDLIKNIHQQNDEQNLRFALKYILSKNQSFLDARDKFSILHNQAFDIFGRYGSVLFATPRTFELLQKANASLAIIADKMWILTPNGNPDNPPWKEHYLRYADENALTTLSNQCDKTHQYVAGISGIVKGIITAPIMEQNGWTFIKLVRKGFGLLGLIKSMHKGDDISGRIDSVFPPQNPPQ